MDKKFKCFIGVMPSYAHADADACAMLVFPAGSKDLHQSCRPNLVSGSSLKQLRELIMREVDAKLAFFASEPEPAQQATRPAKQEVSMDCLTIDYKEQLGALGGDTLFDLGAV